MKKTYLIFFTCLICLNINAQQKSPLYGEWRVERNDKDHLILHKLTEKEKSFPRFGQFMNFLEDGTYQENASAPCGLDDNRYSYHARWSYDSKNKIIEIKDIEASSKRPNIYQEYELLTSGKMKVISVNSNTLTISIIKSWEKITTKN